MENAWIADRLDALASLLELADANPYTVRAYRRAAEMIRAAPGPVGDLVAAGRGRGLRGGGAGSGGGPGGGRTGAGSAGDRAGDRGAAAGARADRRDRRAGRARADAVARA